MPTLSTDPLCPRFLSPAIFVFSSSPGTSKELQKSLFLFSVPWTVIFPNQECAREDVLEETDTQRS